MPALKPPFHAFAGLAERWLGAFGRLALIGLLLIPAVLWPAWAQPAAPLQLHDDVAVHDGWAVAQVLTDPGGRLGCLGRAFGWSGCAQRG